MDEAITSNLRKLDNLKPVDLKLEDLKLQVHRDLITSAELFECFQQNDVLSRLCPEELWATTGR